MEEIFQDKPNELDSIFDIPPADQPEHSKLQVEDLIVQKKVRPIPTQLLSNQI